MESAALPRTTLTTGVEPEKIEVLAMVFKQFYIL